MGTQNNRPILLLIRGIPGSGKSYFAKYLYSEIKDTSAILLDPDKTDYDSAEYHAHVEQQIREDVAPALHPYRFLRAKAYQGIKNNQIIIWNQPFSNLDILKKVTARLEEFALENNTQLTILLVEVAIDPSIAKERVRHRIAKGGHGPSDKTFERFTENYKSAKELGYEIIPIDGLTNPELSAPAVIRRITEIRA